jgi:hypothetical protein
VVNFRFEIFLIHFMKEDSMKKTLTLMACVLCVGLAAGAADFYLGATAPVVEKGEPLPKLIKDGDFLGMEPRQGGDTCGDATVIPGLPFNASGMTTGYTNDYDEACPFTGSASPDVVYSYTPPSNINISASVCLGDAGSNTTNYDTKIYIYEGSCPGTVAGCNDDDCTAPNYGSPFNSALENIALTGGTTYYFVVDGYGGEFGNYTLDIWEYFVPVCPCTGSEVPEGEVGCGNPDTHNGGCNTFDPPVYDPATFSVVSCNTSYCGTTGTDDAASIRDTDWYLLDMPQADTVHFTVTSAVGVNMFVLGDIISTNCGAVSLIDQNNASDCIPATIDFAAPAGENFLWVGPDVFSGLGCPPHEYIMEIACDVVPVELQQFLVE